MLSERTCFYAFGPIVPDRLSICTTASPGRVATWAEQSTCFLAPGKVVWGAHTSKKQKNWRRLFVIPEKLAEKVRKSQRQDFATKVC